MEGTGTSRAGTGHRAPGRRAACRDGRPARHGCGRHRGARRTRGACDGTCEHRSQWRGQPQGTALLVSEQRGSGLVGVGEGSIHLRQSGRYARGTDPPRHRAIQHAAALFAQAVPRTRATASGAPHGQHQTCEFPPKSQQGPRHAPTLAPGIRRHHPCGKLPEGPRAGPGRQRPRAATPRSGGVRGAGAGPGCGAARRAGSARVGGGRAVLGEHPPVRVGGQPHDAVLGIGEQRLALVLGRRRPPSRR